MSNFGVCHINRWSVRNNAGEVIERFNTQSQAIDFANRTAKQQSVIVLIDINKSELQLIERNVREEKVG